MYMNGYNGQELDGFNPLKAIGRALGSTGRAIVGAVVPGIGTAVQGVLDVAAKGPSATTSTLPVPAGGVASQAAALVSAPATATANTPTATNQDALNKSVVDLIATMAAKQNAAAPSAPNVVVTTPGSGGGGPVYVPSPAGGQSPLPSWAIPAAIGGAALLLVMSQKRGR
jgi:hypothetical protein